MADKEASNASRDEKEKQKAENGSIQAAGVPLTSIDHPGQNDVMFGRGGDTNYHVGNTRFRQFASEYIQQYMAASRKEKPVVARLLVDSWRAKDPPGRFLRRMGPSKEESLWEDVGNQEATKKAAKILSELSRGLRSAQSDGGKKKPKSSETSRLHASGEQPTLHMFQAQAAHHVHVESSVTSLATRQHQQHRVQTALFPRQLHPTTLPHENIRQSSSFPPQSEFSFSMQNHGLQDFPAAVAPQAPPLHEGAQELFSQSNPDTSSIFQVMQQSQLQTRPDEASTSISNNWSLDNFGQHISILQNPQHPHGFQGLTMTGLASVAAVASQVRNLETESNKSSSPDSFPLEGLVAATGKVPTAASLSNVFGNSSGSDPSTSDDADSPGKPPAS